MNGDLSAEAEKPPPLDATDRSSSNTADSTGKKRKKEALKPIITASDAPEAETPPDRSDSKTGYVLRSFFASSSFGFRTWHGWLLGYSVSSDCRHTSHTPSTARCSQTAACALLLIAQSGALRVPRTIEHPPWRAPALARGQQRSFALEVRPSSQACPSLPLPPVRLHLHEKRSARPMNGSAGSRFSC